MIVSARLKNVRISPEKARLVADLVRGQKVGTALDWLRNKQQKAAPIIQKLLRSAIANAENNHKLAVDHLKVSMICVDQGPRYKRMQARAKGRGSRVLKPTAHITVQVAEFIEK